MLNSGLMTGFSSVSRHSLGLGLAAVVVAVAAVGVLSPRAGASREMLASKTSVAVVDLARLLEGLDERQSLEANLNSEIDARQAELDKLTGEIQRMTEDLKMLGEGEANQAVRLDRIRSVRLKEVEARALRQFVTEQLSLEKGQMLAVIYNKIQQAVGDVANRDGWDLVLIDDSKAALPGMAAEQQMNQLILSKRVLFAAPGVDITEDVKTLMNNQFNAGRP